MCKFFLLFLNFSRTNTYYVLQNNLPTLLCFVIFPSILNLYVFIVNKWAASLDVYCRDSVCHSHYLTVDHIIFTLQQLLGPDSISACCYCQSDTKTQVTESDQLTVLPRPARQVANTVLLLFSGQSDGMIALLQEQGVRGCIICNYYRGRGLCSVRSDSQNWPINV